MMPLQRSPPLSQRFESLFGSGRLLRVDLGQAKSLLAGKRAHVDPLKATGPLLGSAQFRFPDATAVLVRSRSGSSGRKRTWAVSTRQSRSGGSAMVPGGGTVWY